VHFENADATVWTVRCNRCGCVWTEPKRTTTARDRTGRSANRQDRQVNGRSGRVGRVEDLSDVTKEPGRRPCENDGPGCAEDAG